MPFETPLPSPPVPPPTAGGDLTIPLKDLKPKDYTNVKLNEVWVMFYRHGMSYLNWKFFHFKGTLEEAKKRAERHAQIMGYTRGCFVRPLIVDIDFEERWKQERGVDPIGG